MEDSWELQRALEPEQWLVGSRKENIREGGEDGVMPLRLLPQAPEDDGRKSEREAGRGVLWGRGGR